MAAADILFASIATPTFEPLDTIAVPSKRKWTETEPLIDSIDTMAARKNLETVTFDAATHLDFQPPTKIHTMKELGLGDKGISPVAVSEPFQLFTADAITQMRSEVLSDAVRDNCTYSSNLAHCQLRGFAPQQVHHLLESLLNAMLTIADMLLSSTMLGVALKSWRLCLRLLALSWFQKWTSKLRTVKPLVTHILSDSIAFQPSFEWPRCLRHVLMIAPTAGTPSIVELPTSLLSSSKSCVSLADWAQ